MEQKLVAVKVTKNSDTGKTAGAIAHRIREGNTVNVTAAGGASVHIAVKAIATARRFVQEDGGFDLASYPKYTNIEMNEDTVKGISIIVERKQV